MPCKARQKILWGEACGDFFSYRFKEGVYARYASPWIRTCTPYYISLTFIDVSGIRWKDQFGSYRNDVFLKSYSVVIIALSIFRMVSSYTSNGVSRLDKYSVGTFDDSSICLCTIL